MRPGIIITARMGSKRFPRKHLEPFRDTTVLNSCLDRCMETGLGVVLAIPNEDDAKEWREAMGGHRIGLGLFQPVYAAEDDVLGRVIDAATWSMFDPVIRITGDCPLTEPGLILEVLASHVRIGVADITSNVWPDRHFAKGLDVEVVKLAALKRVRDASTYAEREHVTLGVYDSDRHMRILTHVNDGIWPCADEASLCIDTPEDLGRLNK